MVPGFAIAFLLTGTSLWQLTQYGSWGQPPGRRGAVVKVRDAMTGDVLTMTPGRTLRDAAAFMAQHNVGAVVIMDPEQPGPGIFSERDLVRSIGKGEDPDAEHVSEHLTSHAAFADIDWDLEEAADSMARGGFRPLVVVESGALCGIISMRDIMRVWRPSARPVAST